MPSTYSSNLKIELLATGENSGTWGNITNTNLGTALEQAIVGYGAVSYASDANLTISITNSNSAQAARALVLNVTSAVSLTGTRELVVPTIEKQYIVQNNTTGSQSITVKTSAGTGITVPNGRKAHLYVDGTNVIQMFDFVDINGGTIDGTPIGGSSAAAGSFTTLGASGAATFNGAVTLGDAAADLLTFNGTINSHLLFTDNTYDIGANGATRPRNLFLAGNATVGGNLSVGGTLTLTGGVNLNGNVTVGDNASDTLTINSTITSNLLFTDNTYDIGASGATRPRNLFLAGNATIGGNATTAGRVIVDDTTDSTSGTTGSIQTDGGLGVAKALFVGTSVTINGGTANGVTYLDGSKVLTTGSALTFDGSLLTTPTFRSAGNAFFYGSTGDRLNIFPQVAGSGVQILVTNNANSAYAPLTLDGSATIFNTNGSEAMRLTSVGLGIGTSSPQQKLHVATAGNNYIVSHNTAGSTSALLLGAESGQNTIYSWTTVAGSTGRPLAFYTGPSEAMRLDTSGNLGLGVTPSAWRSATKVLQINNAAFRVDTDASSFVNNAFINSSNQNIYINNGFATSYAQTSGQHLWFTAPSGTAGNAISFTQAMTLDASGNLGIGTSSPASKLQITSGAVRVTAESTTNSSNAGYRWSVKDSGGNVGNSGIYVEPTASINGRYFGFAVDDSTYAMVLNNSGNLGLGVTPTAQNNYAIFDLKGREAAQAAIISFFTSDNTKTGAIQSDTSYGLLAAAGGARPIAFFTNGSERARITSGGDLLVGKTSTNTNVAGTEIYGGSNAGVLALTFAGRPLYINRLTTDGTLVEFAQDGTTEGSISVSGTTVSYNTSSDYRLKDNIAPLTGALAKVQALKPVTYKWKADGSDGEGFIAHELAEVCPQAVTGEKDAVDAEGKPVYQGIDTSFLVATLTAAIQEQQAIIEALTARVAALESK